MEYPKRRFSADEEFGGDSKKIKLEQIPVFVELHESNEDSFCVPDSHLRLNTNPNTEYLPFQCDLCGKKFNFFTSFSLHVQVAHREENENYVPDIEGIYCEICYETFDKFKDKVHHINLAHYGNKGEFVHKNNLKKLLQKDTVTLNIVVKDKWWNDINYE